MRPIKDFSRIPWRRLRDLTGPGLERYDCPAASDMHTLGNGYKTQIYGIFSLDIVRDMCYDVQDQ